MCGIAGIINFNQGLAEKEILKKMIEKVRYRGPDDEGYFINKNVGLGHARLSIIDLSESGHQPMSNETGSVWIVHNGEIYNYLELRESLKKVGHIFKSNTDTEVIIHAYEEWGEDCCKRFNGMWAFAILDLAKKKVILSRDRFSIKPLYYTTSNRTFYFGSEIKQLLLFVNKKEINQDLMFKFLKQAIIDFNQETFFKGIYKVKPRHNLIVDIESGEMKEIKYWDYSFEEIPQNEEEIIEKFRELFIDSVKIRLRGDVPIGALLSGGLDSSSIAVVANKLRGGNFDCFSAVSEDKKYSEEKFVNILGNKAGIKIKKLFSEPKLVWDKLEEVLWHHDEPFAGFSVVIHNQIIELIKRNADTKVLLSGQGGDETLCGYRKFFFFYLQNELKKGNISNVLKNILLSLFYRTVLWQFSLAEAKRYLPSFQKHNDPIDSILKINGELEPIWESENLRKRQILDINKYSVPALTHYEDRNSMGFGLEIRLPFLDYRLVNFVLNLPSSLKIKNGWTKYILRRAINELPKEIAWRRDKQGFINPEKKWLKHDFQNKIIDLFKESKLDEAGIIDKNKLLEVYRNFLRGDIKTWYADITRFLIAELWIRKLILN